MIKTFRIVGETEIVAMFALAANF